MDDSSTPRSAGQEDNLEPADAEEQLPQGEPSEGEGLAEVPLPQEEAPEQPQTGEPQPDQRRNTRPLGPPPSRLMELVSSRKGMMILAGLSLAMLVIAIAGGLYWLSLQNQSVPTVTEMPPPVSLSELATEFPELASILLDPKLDSVYKDFLIAYQQGGEEAAYELAKKRGLLNARDELRMTLELDTTDTAELQAALEAHGILVTAVSGNLMDIAIPLDVLGQALASDDPGALFADIVGLEHILRIRLPLINVQDAGDVNTESLGVIGADVWQAAGFTGQGVKVGVLDGGFDRYKELLGSDLPADAVVKSFVAGLEPDQIGTVHGCAVAEIIYDIAPDAKLFMAAYDTDAEEQLAVDWLLSQGVQIISHSRSSMYGPMNGTSYMAQLVDQTVAKGILWVNSAGNTGYTHYRAPFVDTDGDGFHEFAPRDELMAFNPSGRVSLILNWDDWGNGTQDFDLYLLDQNGNELASSKNVQNGPGDDSAEVIYYEFTDSGPYELAFQGVRVDREVMLNFFMRDGAIEYYTADHSVTTPGDAFRSLTVGATNWSDDKLEDYSSQGPTSDGRMKPELVAPAGVSSAAYGSTWLGTSASTPHVSGAAALILSAYPDFTPQQITDYLTSRAVDLGPAGPDNGFGFGRLYLGPAPDLTVLPTSAPTLSPASPTPLTPVTPLASPTVTAGTLTATLTPTVVRVPIGASNDMGALALGLMICVFVPGLLGLGGIALVGGVWYSRRQSQPRGRPQPPRYPAAAPRPAYPPSPRPMPQYPAPPQPVGTDICPRCSTPYRAGARFCTKCGYVLAAAPTPAAQPTPKPVFCQYCGRPLRPESRFCANCGKPVRK